MEKPAENKSEEKPVITPVPRPRPPVTAWNPKTIPGRRPFLSGKIKFTITPTASSVVERDKR